MSDHLGQPGKTYSANQKAVMLNEPKMSGPEGTQPLKFENELEAQVAANRMHMLNGLGMQAGPGYQMGAMGGQMAPTMGNQMAPTMGGQMVPPMGGQMAPGMPGQMPTPMNLGMQTTTSSTN